MNMLMIDTDTTLKEFKNLIQEKNSKHHPRVYWYYWVIQLYCCATNIENYGGYSYHVLCSEENYIGSQEVYICKQPIVKADCIPLSQLADPYNLVHLYSNLYLQENIQLISHIVPDMKKFIFIGDERQINQTQ